ncbi:deoxyguanosinetriphosphate triphosphohydrolase [Nocardioides sp.]|uniref:deoxyguanosinetriphosphate triphosphohydrolase n=1 Tax=Nocardioides sp. TaxID=35761 RepID=UPI003529358F
MSTSPTADHYAAADRERLVEEPPKRVDAPVRTPFERDRARVVHAASSRRLAAKTQVVGPQTDDFVRNRLTHSLEVAQVARDLARALGCHPDIAETAALAHDLGHPPFGHNGERALADLAKDAGGFEGNAQTLRLLTRLEAKTFDADGRSAGLNLTRATLDACTKYPWSRSAAEPPQGLHADGSPRTVVKFGVYDDDRPVFDWMRQGAVRAAQCVEAQVMDLADDVAYSVHDVEDGVVAGRIELTAVDRPAVWQTVREWYVPDADDALLDEVLDGLVAIEAWPRAAYDGSRRHLAALKNLTSDVIGRFCGAVQEATFAAGEGPFVRYRAALVVPERTRLEIAVLKGIAAHYVMRADDRVALMERQRGLLAELVEALLVRGPEALDRPFADDWAGADDAGARLRVVVDQVASLTDASAVSRHAELCG